MFSLIRKRYCHIFEPRRGFQNWGPRSLGVKGTWVIGRLSYKSSSIFFSSAKRELEFFCVFGGTDRAYYRNWKARSERLWALGSRFPYPSLLAAAPFPPFSFVGGRVRLRVGYIILESSGRYCDRKSAALKIGSWQYRENCEPPPSSQKVITLSESRFKKKRPNNNFLVRRE